MFQVCGVFAQFERGMIRERVNAGIARAKGRGTRSTDSALTKSGCRVLHTIAAVTTRKRATLLCSAIDQTLIWQAKPGEQMLPEVPDFC